jgi:hypothetical protein
MPWGTNIPSLKLIKYVGLVLRVEKGFCIRLLLQIIPEQ